MIEEAYANVERDNPPGTRDRVTVSLVNAREDDTLRYKVLVTKAVPQDTVRISVDVAALARPDEPTDEVMAGRIRPALERFIRGDWMLSGLERNVDAVGFERLSLRATARVPFSENLNLVDRARVASQEGLSISTPGVDRALAPDKVAVVVRNLWFQVSEHVNTHMPQFERLTGRRWRIGDIEYGLPERGGDRPRLKGAHREEEDQFWAETDDAAALQGAERVSLIALVTLRANAASD
jgi:hypothetical protein